MYGCENWTINKGECRRTDASELWCWRRLLIVPWIARRSSQSILKEISPEYSLEGLMPKLKLQYIGHLMQRADSFEKTWCWERLKVGGEGDNRGWDSWMASLTRWTWVWINSRSWWWTGRPGVLQSMGSQRVRYNWTELFFILSEVLSPLFSSSILSTYRPGEFTFQCYSFLPFHTVHGVLKARILNWFVIPFSSGPHFVRIDFFFSISLSVKYENLSY